MKKMSYELSKLESLTKAALSFCALAMIVMPRIASANMTVTSCSFPTGVHFGKSAVLYTETNGSIFDSNRDVRLIDGLNGDLGSLTENLNPETISKGKAATFTNPDKTVSVTITVETNSKTIGSWDSSNDLPEPDKHCSPSSAIDSSVAKVLVTRTENGKTRQTHALLYCMFRGGYHGYWGQGDCPEPK